MDVSFQPKSQMPDQGKSGPSFAEIFADIRGLYVGEKKSMIVIGLTILPFIFIGAIVGMMVVNSSLDRQVQAKKQELAALDGKVAKLPMKDIRDMSNRLRVVSAVVKNEPFITTFFKFLEYSIEDDVLFKKTDLSSVNISGVDTYAVSIDSEAKSYAAVVNQLDTIRNRDPYRQFFSDVKMQNLSVDKKGLISFKIAANMNIKNLLPEDVESKFLSQDNGPTPVIPSTDSSASSTVKSGSSTTP